jgi:hypothetical protein
VQHSAPLDALQVAIGQRRATTGQRRIQQVSGSSLALAAHAHKHKPPPIPPPQKAKSRMFHYPAVHSAARSPGGKRQGHLRA